ncbi:hypothetical protein T265_01691 [Opisthorchis viverrini]|uniref:Uncharacterized protein n=1 Tax=Opisthorchis viverrini TaxID=6198 RepID=A0A075A1Z5_OPIVI|nr:hypothetical protein T265_01691 [Opisthorchis viverrini]KER32262.1 hypothetical protein T265_01691 [Opisthorchis viverrini]
MIRLPDGTNLDGTAATWVPELRGGERLLHPHWIYASLEELSEGLKYKVLDTVTLYTTQKRPNMDGIGLTGTGYQSYRRKSPYGTLRND